jgi:hypothetical protein
MYVACLELYSSENSYTSCNTSSNLNPSTKADIQDPKANRQISDKDSPTRMHERENSRSLTVKGKQHHHAPG